MPKPNKGYELKWFAHKDSSAAYHIVWFERGKRRTHPTGIRERGCLEEAEAYRARWVAKRQRPTSTSDPDQIKIAAVLDLYAREHAPETEDPERIGDAIKALLPFWGTKLVSEIKGEVCREYRRGRKLKSGKRAANGTVRRELLTLSAALNYCAKEQYLSVAPKLWLPKKSQRRERWLTRKEVAALIRAARNEPKAKNHLPLFILLGVHTGARSQAILSLQWIPHTSGGHIDLEAGRIDFNPIKRRQTNKRRAVIPIPNVLLPHLCRAARLNKRYVVESHGSQVKSVKRSFKTARKAAGLGSEVVPHILRHTAATWMAQSGIDKWQALGWLEMTAETWEKNYAHHDPDYLADAKRAVDRPTKRRVDKVA